MLTLKFHVSLFEINLDKQYTYDLSIIIVNYNVEYFLDQCLSSVKKACEKIDAEVIIIDNASQDTSMEMVEQKHPEVKCIKNKENVGFSVANNQGIEISQGKYVLLLNPDTVVEEDTLYKCVQFMDEHQDAGGLGIRMVNGKGEFLPESKRGLPKPSVAFYKLSGLARLFPRSKRFNQYHAGHIKETETSEVEILSGAFMMMRKTALDKVGLLDETFFMYGEDIDLSYRILLGGYKNYYFADSEIIHYKGESTKKSSANYVFVFYRAMIIFAKKHFAQNNAALFSLLINLGIYLRASGALLSRIVKQAFLPLIDLSYISVGLFALTNYWSKANIEFPYSLIRYAIPTYALIWLFSLLINGAYDKPLNLTKALKGALIGTAIILIGYAMLPKSLQFSRLFIFIGAAWVVTYYLLSRFMLHFMIGKKYRLFGSSNRTFAIIGSQREAERVQTLLEKTQNGTLYFRSFTRIAEINNLKSTEVDEIVYCSKDLYFDSIIQSMIDLRNKEWNFKIAPDDRNYLIGSNSIDTAGDLYVLQFNTLTSTENKRKKRLFDFTFSFVLLIAAPFILVLNKNGRKLIRDIFHVFTGRKTFIGFSPETQLRDVRLPKIKTGLITPSDAVPNCDADLCDKLNLIYSRDYSIRKDFQLVVKGWKNLSRN